MSSTGPIETAEALRIAELIAPVEGGIASRVLAKNGGGSVTVFAFDAGEGLSEHSTPFDALALTLDGALTLTIGGRALAAPAGTIVRFPANVPHSVDASAPSRMLLIMLREPKPATP